MDQAQNRGKREKTRDCTFRRASPDSWRYPRPDPLEQLLDLTGFYDLSERSESKYRGEKGKGENRARPAETGENRPVYIMVLMSPTDPPRGDSYGGPNTGRPTRTPREAMA